jgi:predicted membrane channel-forming protein YqfA (hemolysin III family)
MTPEFRTQTLVIMALIAATFLIPLWKQLIPDWLRGGLFILLGVLPLPALSAFFKLMPALEKLYHHPLKPGPGVYFLVLGMLLMLVSGGLLLIATRRTVH